MKSVQSVLSERVWEAGPRGLGTRAAATALLRLLTAQSQHVNLLMSPAEQERAPDGWRKTSGVHFHVYF